LWQHPETMSRPISDLSLLRRACAPCTLRQFCQQAAGAGAPELVAGKAQSLARGNSLFRVGDGEGSVYIVRNGALKTVAVTEDGAEHVLGFHLPGELVGLDSLATGAHCVEAVALADSQVCAVPMNVLLARGTGTPALGRDLLQLFGRTALESHSHVDVLMRRQAGERIALFLHNLLQRARPVDGTTELHLPMSREDVARYLGLALETVSRGFTKLQDEGVILVAGRSVRIIDTAQLRQLALLPPSEDEGGSPLERHA
jgi:CRP/FNR family transcriptional regulator, anaerobic regulatory protein